MTAKFKIILYAFKLAHQTSFDPDSKISFELSTQNRD